MTQLECIWPKLTHEHKHWLRSLQWKTEEQRKTLQLHRFCIMWDLLEMETQNTNIIFTGVCRSTMAGQRGVASWWQARSGGLGSIFAQVLGVSVSSSLPGLGAGSLQEWEPYELLPGMLIWVLWTASEEVNKGRLERFLASAAFSSAMAATLGTVQVEYCLSLFPTASD